MYVEGGGHCLFWESFGKWSALDQKQTIMTSQALSEPNEESQLHCTSVWTRAGPHTRTDTNTSVCTQTTRVCMCKDTHAKTKGPWRIIEREKLQIGPEQTL